jgi:hypothetical protein
MPVFGDSVELFLFLPGWLATLIVVLSITWTICMAGIALGKIGRNPLWALVAFLWFPLLTAGLWYMALARWPRLDPKPPAG